MDKDKAKKSVKTAGILALVSFALTLGITLFSMSQGSVMGFNEWNLIDAVLV